MKSRRKLVAQVGCSIPEGAVCGLETGVNWWLKKSDQCGWSRRLDCEEITQVTWRRRKEELICGGDNFVFNAFCTLSQCSDVRIRDRNKMQKGRGKRTFYAFRQCNFWSSFLFRSTWPKCAQTNSASCPSGEVRNLPLSGIDWTRRLNAADCMKICGCSIRQRRKSTTA